MSNIPERLNRKRGPSKTYLFDTMLPGKENGHEELCPSNERDRKWASLKSLCFKYSVDGKKFSCYPTELGVFYWREQ